MRSSIFDFWTDPFRHFAQRRSSFKLRDFEEGLRKLEFKLRNNEVNDLFHILDRSNTGEITFSNFSIFVNGTRYNDSENKLNYLITKMASSWDGGRDVKRAFERIDRSDKGKYFKANALPQNVVCNSR